MIDSAPPCIYADRRLYEPIARWLQQYDSPPLPDAAALTRLLASATPDAVTQTGHRIHFSPQPAPENGYEAGIHDTGTVPTRPDDWHDFFNALSWCAWPRSKAALNAAHLREIEARRIAGLSGRGTRRDALTQFDECGMVVVSSDAEVLQLLAAHEWEEVFWKRRAALADNTAFLVFGHGSWDQLRAPFIGLCARTLHRAVSADWFCRTHAAQLADTDAWLAGSIARDTVLHTPRDLKPLPLLGIPGVTHDNEDAAYYRDTRQFRPAPRRTPS